MLPFLYQALGLSPGFWNCQVLLLAPRREEILARDLVPGDGKAAKFGTRVTIEFTASTLAGKELANTEKRGLPYIFPVQKQPDMWTRLVAGMQVNGERMALVFPEEAYGVKGVPGIVPPNEPLLIWLRLTSSVPNGAATDVDPAAP